MLSLSEQQWCPTSVQVTVQQARGLRVKGKSGTNDAYAVMQVGKEKFQTSVMEKTVAPVWKEEAAFDLPPLLLQQHGGGGGGGGGGRDTLHVHVLHRALVGPDKLLGQAVINLLQLSEDTTRNKTEWFKLLDKTGKPDKDRGEVLVEIQFMRNNMTASMFDLSNAGKSKSRLGKFKDKVRGKKKESDTTSNVAPSFAQVLTDSEEEGTGDGEVAAGKGEKKKKHKMKSLFSPKSNLQKNMSQSMTVLPAKNSSPSGSQSSGLNMDSSEGKKKFKFLKHKRSGSSESKDSSSAHQKHAAAEQSNLCINGSHVYCEEPPPRTSRIGSNFSLTSSGHGSMEDVPESSPPSVDSLRAVRQYSPWTEEEEEEVQNIKEDVGELRSEDKEKTRMEERRKKEEEEERVRRQEEELKRLAEEKRSQEEEERRRAEEERVKREEEDRIRREEEERRRQEEEEKVRREERLAEEKRRLEQEERRIEEERKEEEERIRREKEEKRRQEEEERVRREEEEREEKRRLVEQERKRREEEERIRMEGERRRQEEEEMARRQEEEVKLEEKRRLEEQERTRREEEERIRMEEEKRRREEEEMMRRQEEERKLAEEKRRLEEERIEAEKVKEEEEERLRREEEMAEEERRRQEEEEMMRRQEEEREEKRRLEVLERRRMEEEERIKKEEEEKAKWEKEEYERLVEEKRKLEEEERKRIEAEEKIRWEEEERMRVEEERRREEEERVRRQLAEEKRMMEEQERRRIEEEERKQREEEEKIRKEEEERKEKEEKMRQQEEERRRIEEKEMKREEEERIRRAEKERKEEEARTLEREKLKMEAEEQKKKETKLKVSVESPAVPSTNPFDENFEEILDSPAGPEGSAADVSTVQKRVHPAASSVGNKPAAADESDPSGTQREKRPAPQPPGRSEAESQDASKQHVAQINAKTKDIKTVSVPPQRSVHMIAPLSRSPTDATNTQSLMQSSATKETPLIKPSKRPAPSRPRSVDEAPSSEHKTAPSSDGAASCERGPKAKQAPVVYGLNPFDDEEDDVTASDHTGSAQRPPAADKDAASQTKIKSSKPRAPPLPTKKDATSSTLINTEGDHVTDEEGATHKSVTHACDPKPEAVSQVQASPLPESQPATVQRAGEEAGVKKEGPPVTARRLQPVKPLNPPEQQPVSVVQGEKDNKSSVILQEKTKVNDTGLKGPYSQLTREELISLVLKQETQLSERDKKMSELERYIDNLLVRVMEEKPSILMSLNSLKKAA